MDDHSPDESRFENNLKALQAVAPQVAAQLRKITVPHMRLVADADGDVDVVLLGHGFYNGGAKATAATQLDQFFERPLRNLVNTPNPDKLEGTVGDFCRRVMDRMAEAGMTTAVTANPVDTHFVVSFGVGLGFHVAPLVERTSARFAILIEPYLELLWHSMHVVDWAQVLEDAARSGTTIAFVVDGDARRIAATVANIVRSNNPALLDGAYLFTHYPSSVLAQARDLLRRDLYLTLTGMGFFQDEEVMTTHAVANLASGGVHLLGRVLPERAEPLFIVGSGPSLENDIDFVAAHVDRAVVMSIGTSLRALLAVGIAPDFHVEVENLADTADALALSLGGYKVPDTALLASITVHPRVTASFERRVMFFRERVSPTQLFGDGYEIVRPSGPTVANAALAAAMRMGFHEIYFFGIDLGTRQVGKYHAAGTIYATGQLEEPGKPMDRKPGNFGGEVTSIAARMGLPVLDWSRHMLEAALATNPEVRAYNCSDGALIAGALPKLSSTIELKNGKIDRARLRREIFDRLAAVPPAVLRRRWNKAARLAEARTMFDRILGLLEPEIGKSEPSFGWGADMFALVRPDRADSRIICAYVSGTMMLLMGCVFWYERHLTDLDHRMAYRRLALEELVASVRYLDAGLSRLYEQVDGVIAGTGPKAEAAA